jgi:hypothetical protein
MKTLLIGNIRILFSVAIIVSLFACEKNDDLNLGDVSGTYIGTLTGDFRSIQPATTVVSNIGDHIEIHCFAENFDTTITLDIYNNADRMMVCLTGEEFENMYGHMLGEGNMNHHGSDWMQHLNDEHQEGDEHFGFFDMQLLTFEFTFQMDNGNFHFQGTRN